MTYLWCGAVCRPLLEGQCGLEHHLLAEWAVGVGRGAGQSQSQEQAPTHRQTIKVVSWLRESLTHAPMIIMQQTPVHLTHTHTHLLEHVLEQGVGSSVGGGA